jgi:two-component system, LuxR family, sensor kinase FixL
MPAAPTILESRYRRLFETAQDGILVVDPATRKIVDVNPFLIRFLGYRHDEFVGKELFEIGLPNDEAASQTAFRQLVSVGYIRYENLPLQTKKGQRVEVEFVSNLYEEGTHQIIQCNVRDIVARKRIEKDRHDAESRLGQQAADLERLVGVRTAELQLSNRQLDTFVYSITHDLRAPLRVMQGFAELLTENHASDLKPEGLHYVSLINQAAAAMDRLLVDLLDFSHINRLDIQLERVSLETVVQSAIASCESEIRKSKGQVECVGPWPPVLAHAATLQQVLVNLIENALKFVADKPPKVVLRAEARPDGVLRIWVEDNGIGVPLQFQKQIFEVFHRLHAADYPGTGIGLAIVQKGMDRMGGRAGVTSAVGQGSHFWIELAIAGSAAPLKT